MDINPSVEGHFLLSIESPEFNAHMHDEDWDSYLSGLTDFLQSNR